MIAFDTIVCDTTVAGQSMFGVRRSWAPSNEGPQETKTKSS